MFYMVDEYEFQSRQQQGCKMKNSRGRTGRRPRLTRFYWWPVKWSQISLFWLSNYQPCTLGNLLLNSTHIVRKWGGEKHSKSCHVTMFSTSHSFRRLCILGKTIRTATISNHVVVNFQDPSFLTFLLFFFLVSTLSIPLQWTGIVRHQTDSSHKIHTYTKYHSFTVNLITFSCSDMLLIHNE